MSPAYSNTNDEKASTVTPSDTTYPDDTFSSRNEDRLNASENSKTQYQKNENNEKLCYSTSELQLRKKTKKKELKQFSKCKALMNVGIIGSEAKNCFFQDDQYRSEREAVLVFGGIDPHADYGRKGNTGKDVYRYKPDENIWEFVGEMPEPRHHHSVAYLTGRIYLVGGADPREDDIQRRNIALGTVWSYDPRVKNWYSEPNMLTPRQNFGLVVSDDKIFAIGGQNKTGIALKTVEVFDPVTREWKEVRSMHIARVGPASVKYEGHIWVAGGMTKSKREPLTKDVEFYDPSTNIWYKAEPLQTARCFSCMYVSSNRLFVIGGVGKTFNAESNVDVESIGCIDVWDPNLCVWQRQTEISTARHGHTVSSIGNQLIILGGVTTLHMKALKSVECYNFERDKWIKGISPLPFAISGHGSLSLPTSYLLAD